MPIPDTRERAMIEKPTLAPDRQPLVTFRALLLGLAGAVAVCVLTPVNDFLYRNTALTPSTLALGVMIWMLLLVLGVNAALLRWWPRKALGLGELTTVTSMVLIASTLPSLGLMRYLPGHLVAFWAHAANNPTAEQVLRTLDLPAWLFPTFGTDDVARRGLDPVVRGYYGTATTGEESGPFAFLQVVPWSAWVTPALTWGLFLTFFLGTILCLMSLFRHQWVENERLTFPIAQVYLAVLEPPDAGRSFNRLFRSPLFWITCGAVFLLHGSNALAAYYPRYIPTIPTGFSIRSIITDSPLRHISWESHNLQVYLAVVGLCFFLRTQLSFSLWFVFVLAEGTRIYWAEVGASRTGGMEADQQFGAVTVLAAVTIFVARRHLRTVIAQMFRRPLPGEPEGRYLTHRVAGWGVVIGLAGQAAWLTAAGMTPIGAISVTLMLVTVMLVVARVIAETGMPYVLLPIEFHRPFLAAAHDLPMGLSFRTALGNYFFAHFFHSVFTQDNRVTAATSTAHAFRLADRTLDADRTSGMSSPDDSRRPALAFFLALVMALGVGYLAAGAGHLTVMYNFSTSLDRNPEYPRNWWGGHHMARVVTLDRTADQLPPSEGRPEPHNRIAHFGFGAAVTAALGALRLNFVGWPIHPIGFVLAYTWGMKVIAFSVFLGWLAKALVSHLGGTTLVNAARPLFLGLILGELMTSAFWLLVTLALAVSGFAYHPVQLAP